MSEHESRQREYSLAQVYEMLETAFRAGADMDIDRHEIIKTAHGMYDTTVECNWECGDFENHEKRAVAIRCCTAAGEIATSIAKLKNDSEITKADFITACHFVQSQRPRHLMGVVCT